MRSDKNNSGLDQSSFAAAQRDAEVRAESHPSEPAAREDEAGSVWLRVPTSAIFSTPEEPPSHSNSNGQVNGQGARGSLSLPATPPLAARGYGSYGGFYGGASGGAYSEEGEGFNFHHLFGTLFRYRKLVLSVWATVVVIAAILTITAPSVYQATATMLVNASSSGGKVNDLPGLSDFVGATQARSLNTQIALLNKPEVQQAALQTLPPAIRKKLREYSQVQIAPSGSSDLVDISALSHDPKAAASLANAVGLQYLEANRRRNRTQVHAATNYVKKQLQTVRGQLNNARLALMRYKQQTRTVDINSEAQARVAEASEIAAGQREARAEKQALIARVEKLRSEMAQTAPGGMTPTGLVRRPAVESMKAQLTKLELSRMEALQEYTPRSDEVQAIEGQIAALRKQLRGEAQTEVQSWQPDPLATSLTQQIAQAQGEIWAVEARGIALKAEARRANTELSKVPSREYHLGQLMTDMEALKQTYQMLNENYQTLRISEEAEVANAQIASWAQVPGSPVSPRRGRNMLMAMMLGLLLAVGCAVLLDTLSNRVHSEEEATRITGRPVLAHIPLMPKGASPSLLANASSASPLLDSYRMLRANIEFSALEKPIRSVAVTSSRPNEGKSISSVNLAVVMALDGKRVILVDCDLRRPNVHQLFQLSNAVGFTNVVAGSVPLAQALQQTTIPNLQVLTSGIIPPNPTELLNSKAGRACISQLLEQADMVILDCPPALVMADAQIVASLADAALLVVSANEAGRREVAATSRQLEQSNINLLGIVLNKTQQGIGHGYYNYDHYAAYQNGDGASAVGINGAASQNGAAKDEDGALAVSAKTAAKK